VNDRIQACDEGDHRRAPPRAGARGARAADFAARVQAFAAAALDAPDRRLRSTWFLIGDLHLQVLSDARGFLDELEAQYRDCIVEAPRAGAPRIRCDARRLPGSALIGLVFEGDGVPDPFDAAGTPFRIVRDFQRYARVDGPAPGWHMLVDGVDGGRPVVAGDGRRLVVDLDHAPPEFASDCVVNVAQGAQRDVLFLHAASFGIAGAGAVLVGWSRSGKSTSALALAARGHDFLGDDVAAIRTRSRELLPFRKTVSLRPGPFVSSLGARLAAAPHTAVVGTDGEARTVVRMRDLFPAAPTGALPLRFAFLLDGFGAQPRLTPYRPSIADAKRLRPVVNGATPSWGLSPGRDLMRFLAIVDVLSALDCYLVELGSPEASVAAIEHVMEAACRST
jgi:hypothetical protein